QVRARRLSVPKGRLVKRLAAEQPLTLQVASMAVQSRPQTPQCWALPASDSSQPLEATPSQPPSPGSHKRGSRGPASSRLWPPSPSASSPPSRSPPFPSPPPSPRPPSRSPASGWVLPSPPLACSPASAEPMLASSNAASSSSEMSDVDSPEQAA